MHDGAPLEAVLKRDRIIVISGLACVAALSWVYMIYLAGGMQTLDTGMEMAMPRMQFRGTLDLILMFAMWTVMMVAMMVPSAGHMALMFSTVKRSRREQQDPFVPTGVFLLGYLVVWTGFSALFTLAHWALHTAALLSPMMVSSSPILGGVLLLAAGIFQFTHLKYACLTRCRSLLGFLLNEWREGIRGAFIMGLRSGNYCVVCCWALMSLMFVAGVMSLLWMAVIAAFVLLEKVAPGGQWVSRISGLLLILWGAWMLMGVLV